MQSKYIKTALILIFLSVLIITAIFVTVLISVNKASFLKPSNQVTICKEEQAVSLTEQFIKNTPTYVFDGIEGSIEKIKVEQSAKDGTWVLSYAFKCKHPGYGDRTGQALTDQVTGHSAVITIKDCRIIIATCDKNYDLLTNKQK